MGCHRRNSSRGRAGLIQNSQWLRWWIHFLFVLHLQAQRSAKDRIVIFRPQRNAARMAAGADRMSMPEVPEELFVDAVRQVVAANQAYVPPLGSGSLYLRPLLLGTGPILGLGAPPKP